MAFHSGSFEVSFQGNGDDLIDLAREKHFDLLGGIAFGLQAETVPTGREVGFVEKVPDFLLRRDMDLVQDLVPRPRKQAKALDPDVLERLHILGKRDMVENLIHDLLVPFLAMASILERKIQT